MEVIEVEDTTAAIREPLPSLRLTAAVLVLAALLAVVSTVGRNWGETAAAAYSSQPSFRYVNSGWISPQDSQVAGPFADELRAFVIVSQEELDTFQTSYISKATRGNPTSLGRIDFETSVLLAAYYLWRPVKGDPLAVADVVVDGNKAVVQLDLNQDAQGREYAYLYAPMTMVAVERSLFPSDETVEFIFKLAGHPSITLNGTPN